MSTLLQLIDNFVLLYVFHIIFQNGGSSDWKDFISLAHFSVSFYHKISFSDWAAKALLNMCIISC
jgi:hypothetical protein